MDNKRWNLNLCFRTREVEDPAGIRWGRSPTVARLDLRNVSVGEGHETLARLIANGAGWNRGEQEIRLSAKGLLN